jgi:Cu(I)/Ag(I) efflux system membrane fusion protein
MKKIVLPIIIAVAGVGAYFLFFKKNDAGQPEAPKQQALSLEDKTNAFKNSYNVMLTAYMGLKDALVASDTAKASASARELAVAADSLKIDELQADSLLKETARSLAMSISASANALTMESGLPDKRKEFQMIAEYLWPLSQTVKYDGQKLYWQHCPMAFDNSGANWVSDEREVRNPYFGKEMLDCGTVLDSMDYSARK